MPVLAGSSSAAALILNPAADLDRAGQFFTSQGTETVLFGSAEGAGWAFRGNTGGGGEQSVAFPWVQAIGAVASGSGTKL